MNSRLPEHGLDLGRLQGREKWIGDRTRSNGAQSARNPKVTDDCDCQWFREDESVQRWHSRLVKQAGQSCWRTGNANLYRLYNPECHDLLVDRSQFLPRKDFPHERGNAGLAYARSPERRNSIPLTLRHSAIQPRRHSKFSPDLLRSWTINSRIRFRTGVASRESELLSIKSAKTFVGSI